MEGDLRGMGRLQRWEEEWGGGDERGRWSGKRGNKGGIFEGSGMNEEGRRGLGKGAQRLPSTVSWKCTSMHVCVYVHVHVHLSLSLLKLPPFRCPSWSVLPLAGPPCVQRSTRCRNSLDLSFPRSSARCMSARTGRSYLLNTSTRTTTCTRAVS
jgi:hypothetical protein